MSSIRRPLTLTCGLAAVALAFALPTGCGRSDEQAVGSTTTTSERSESPPEQGRQPGQLGQPAPPASAYDGLRWDYENPVRGRQADEEAASLQGRRIAGEAAPQNVVDLMRGADAATYQSPSITDSAIYRELTLRSGREYKTDPARVNAARRNTEIASTAPHERDLGPGADRETLPRDYVQQPPPVSREDYAKLIDNPFRDVAAGEHTSTFAIDVDTASYSNLRRFLHQGQLPPVDAVRIEEMLNYFDYAYEAPTPEAEHPFAFHVDSSTCPWQPRHRLLRVALQGKKMNVAERPASNLVFLVDVSGSMSSSNKLPLVKQSLKLLVSQLDERDRISLVTYAGNAGLALASTPGNEQARIMQAIDGLGAGGSTNGAGGISMAYQQAAAGFIDGGANRVILATDGDFNVGVTDAQSLTQLIKGQADRGIYLCALGYGSGNYQDARMEQISNDGNGFYAYIDSYAEAQKVFGQQLTGSLVTIAKDVKIQIFFNPARVAAYRLIGYENRQLRAEDFDNDRIDAGDIGAGHSVTALYEIVPAGQAVPHRPPENPFVRPQRPDGDAMLAVDAAHDLMLRLRYQPPQGSVSTLQEGMLSLQPVDFLETDADFRWAAAVASAGMLLRHSPYRGDASMAQAISWAQSARGADTHGHRAEFIKLMHSAQGLLGAGEVAQDRR